ncbi:5'/3'-nucleotidase SurE [Halobacterium bonnevillei]|uniref:5'-nucleotidase SurE n=1 Tax=Halobacterium bonnevillei TaxID=2692200 RepID=A0A6B0SCF7_9EURY|nr:5'/3'-nucleotidase SurE [Halobacterium bonnevillei]MXR19405.1 5'/3'-nucleotidase SurE [Halobacterium bonnevillei]
MSDSLSVLLTNDDGIDAPGIRALYDRLTDRHDVTIVAPAREQSGTGQTRTFERIEYDEREEGYAVHGTPADCVAFGVAALDVTPDIVVSGCNDGPNLGAHILARSGTVGAAMEASFLGLPAIAVSMYDWEFDPAGDWEPHYDQFHTCADTVADVLPGFHDGTVLPTADYLSINAPATEYANDPVKRVTRPTEEYELRATVSESSVNIEDRFWHEFLDRDVPDPAGTDRHACVDNEISISPLTVPHSVAGGATPGGLL